MTTNQLKLVLESHRIVIEDFGRWKSMIYMDNQLKEKIVQMIDDFESEVVEFK